MILVIWQIVPENLKLYELPDEHRQLALAAHGTYIGTMESDSAERLENLLSSFTPVFNEDFASTPAVVPQEKYSLVVVSGELL